MNSANEKYKIGVLLLDPGDGAIGIVHGMNDKGYEVSWIMPNKDELLETTEYEQMNNLYPVISE